MASGGVSRLATGLEILLIFAAPILLLPVVACNLILAATFVGAALLPLAAHAIVMAVRGWVRTLTTSDCQVSRNATLSGCSEIMTGERLLN
jgi:hypothetical protein